MKKITLLLLFGYYAAVAQQTEMEIASDTGNSQVVFNQHANVEMVSASIAFAPELLRPIEFGWTPKTKKLPKAMLQSYIGEYHLSGKKLKIALKNNETLCLMIPNQPSWELEPVSKGKFRLKGVAGHSIVFSQDASELMLTQPKGTFKALKKKA